MSRSVRTTGVLALAAACALAPGTGAAAAGADDRTTIESVATPESRQAERGQTERGQATDLGQRQRGLSRAERELAATLEAIERADVGLREARAAVQQSVRSLADVEDQLADARQAHAAAGRQERQATATFATANTTLQETVSDHATSRDELEARAIAVFKHGPGLPEATLLRGIANSSDWHEATMAVQAVSRIVARDQRLVETTGELTRTLASTRTDVVRARSDAVRAARRAAAERRRIEQLLEREQRALVDLEQRELDLASTLRDLEEDRELRAGLVRALEAQVAELQLAASTVMVPVAADLDLDGPPPDWADLLPAAGRPWAARLDAIAASRGLDGRLLAALVWTESGFRPGAVSHAGARGLAQLMPSTALGLGVDADDPTHNLDGGARYLRAQLERFGRIDLALAAYNAGPGRVTAAGPGIPDIVETQLYVVRVLERYRRLSAD